MTTQLDPPTAPAAAPEDVPARRRLAELTDPASFLEIGSGARHQNVRFDMQHRRPPGDGVVTGTAQVEGRPVAVFAQDGTALGGSLGALHALKISTVQERALSNRHPIVGLLDSGGARIQEGVASLDGYGSIFHRNVRASGRVPQLSVVLGPCAGGAVYSPALTDIVIMERTRARMFLTGPAVVEAVTNEKVSSEELGGEQMHALRSGVAHLVADGEHEALALARRVLSYLPSSCWDPLPLTEPRPPALMPEIPQNPRKVYDVRSVVDALTDGGSFLELQPKYARNLVVGFARVQGCPVGVVANQPQELAGTLDSRASEKGARFVRMCDAFGLPLLTLVDTPGFLPGVAQESEGVIRRGAKLLFAFAEATVPKITVILRKAYGGAYIVMNSKQLGSDLVLAWPGAQVSVMGADGAVNVIFRKELERAPERREELLASYIEQAVDIHLAVDALAVDEVVPPEATPALVATAIQTFQRSARPQFRHDNLPL